MARGKDLSHINPANLSRQGGKSNSYIDTTTGEKISYRQAAKILGAPWAQPVAVRRSPPPPQSGIPAPIQNKRSTSRYWRLVRSYAAQHGIGAKAASQTPEVKYAIQELRRQHQKERKGQQIDLSPTGDYANALVALGVRDPSNPYRVGETPRKRR